MDFNFPNDSVTKRALWRYVNKKIRRSVHHFHVFSVISILFEEILKDLVAGKTIKITNFGTLMLKNLSPRSYYDIHDKVMKVSEPHRIMRFVLASKLRNKICKHLDIDLTFKDDNES